MVTKLSHTSLYVLDQEKAYDFYVNKLGFKVHTDVKMDNGFRWLTLTPPDQPDLQVVLMPVNNNPMMKDDVRNAFKTLLEQGQMGGGVMQTPDCRATYEEMKAKDIDVTEPKEQFYGLECIVTDGCGNWFSMTEPKPGH